MTPQPMPSHSERAIIGCVMLHPHIMETIALRPEDFADERHASTWQVMLGRYALGLPLDMLSIVEGMEDNRLIVKVGGLAYLSSHGDVACVESNLKHQVRQMKERTRRISLIGELKQCCDELSVGDSTSIEAATRIVNSASGVLADTGMSVASRLRAQHEDLMDEATGQREVYIRTGIPGWDTHSLFGGLSTEGITLVLGASGMGKTTLLNRYVLGLLSLGTPVYLHGSETSEDRRLRDLIFSLAGVDGRAWAQLTRGLAELKAKGEYDLEIYREVDGMIAQLEEAQAWLEDKPLHITGAGRSVEQIGAYARQLHRKDQRLVVVVDYLQDIADTIAPGVRVGDRIQQVSHKSSQLKLLAATIRRPVVVGAQVSGEKAGPGLDPRPELWDVQWSSTAHQDAEEVYALFRADYYRERDPSTRIQGEPGVVEVIARKRRTGRLATLELQWDGPSKWIGERLTL